MKFDRPEKKVADDFGKVVKVWEEKKTPFAERTKYLKENPEGVREMCKVIEDMRVQERNETMIEIAKKLLSEGTLTIEKIVECVGLPLEEVKKLSASKTV